MVEWQPINTAPRDGTEILVSNYDVIEVATWCEWRDWQRDPGWLTSRGWRLDPVWWQPLPEHPPLTEGEHD